MRTVGGKIYDQKVKLKSHSVISVKKDYKKKITI